MQFMSWNKIWDEIFLSKKWGQYPGEPLITFIAKYFYEKERSQIKILEIGCGPGANLWFCAREGFEVYGIDISKSAVIQCQERLNNEIPYWKGKIVQGIATKLPFRELYFDAVIDNECCSCIELEDAIKTYNEAWRVLKPKGKLFIRTFSSGSDGDQTGKEISKNTWVTNSGKTAGKGPIRYTHDSDFKKLLPDNKFRTITKELTKESNTNIQKWTIEWLIVVEKIINLDSEK